MLYIANVKIPTQRADGVHVMKMCEALGKRTDVKVVLPKRISKLKNNDPFAYGDIERNFEIIKLANLDLTLFLSTAGYWIQHVSFCLNSMLYVNRNIKDKDYSILTREYLIAFLLSKSGFTNIIFESHRVVSRKKLFFWLVKDVKKIITNSTGVAKEFEANGFEHVIALPNGVDLKEYETILTKAQLRKKYNIPENITVVMYTGHLYTWKGIDTVILAAKNNLDPTTHFYFVGGSEKDIEKYNCRLQKENLKNVHFLGHKPRIEVPHYLKLADVLLIPNVPISEESERYTSPMKMQEYMASGTPIVVSDLPSMRTVLHKKNAYFFEAGNHLDLVKVINEVKLNPKRSQYLSDQALIDVLDLTWDKRAEKMLDFVTKAV